MSNSTFDVTITESMLAELRNSVAKRISGKRLAHTYGVERMAVRLGELYCPEKIPELRAAALLHDITKEETLEKQLQLCREFGIMTDACDVLSPKIFHAKTAAALIGREFPAFASAVVVEAVRWHTTGHEGMTLTEQLIYLADYIDDTRIFPDCVTLREVFWSRQPEKMNREQRLSHLRDVMILSYQMTIRGLLEEGTPVCPDTFLARNELICQRAGIVF